MKQYPEVGDFLRAKKNTTFYKVYGPIEGYVTLVDLWENEGPLTVENHGALNIKLTNVGKISWCSPGEEEHFVVYNWEQDFYIDKE